MSKYTMQLRELFEPIVFTPALYTKADVENWFKDYDLDDYLTEEQQAVITATGLWNKDKLAKKIVNHYYMHEIGFETIGLFIHEVKDFMEELMEEYLPLIYSSAIQYDPLVNVDYTESFSRTQNLENSSSSSSSSDGSSLGVNSDTPQGQISKSAILNGTYASNTSATENEVASETSTSSTGNNAENYLKHIKGNSGVSATAQKMIQLYRDNIRAIDREIIERVGILFMRIY